MDFFDPNKVDEYLISVENYKPDYNTNAESYYKALARHKNFMKLFTAELIQLQNEMQKEFDEHKEITLGKIEEFNSRLDGIKQEMTDFFNQWLADGVLDEVINQDILNQKASKEELALLEQKLTLYIPKTDEPVNITWKGATQESMDNSPIFNMIMDELDTGDETFTGGVIKIPRGNFKGQLIIETSHVSNLASIIVKGDGQQNTIIDGSELPADANAVEIRGGVFVKLKDFQVKFAPKHGIAVLGEQSGYHAWNHLEMENIRSSVNGGSGIYLERGFMGNFKDVFSTNNQQYGFELRGYHTSLIFQTCYAATNKYDNYLIDDTVYSSFISCGSDHAGQFGYRIRNTHTTNFINCGAETCQRSGFHIEASKELEYKTFINKGTNQVTFDGCHVFDCDKAGSGFGNFLNVKQVNESSIKGVKITNCTDKNALNNPNVPSLLITGSNVEVIEDNNKFIGSINYVNGAVRNLIKKPLQVKVPITMPDSKVCSLKNEYGYTDSYSGMVIVTARSKVLTDKTSKVATYILLLNKDSVSESVTEIGKSGYVAGVEMDHPSFTFRVDRSNNRLLASPVQNTYGEFYFTIESQGLLEVIPLI